MNPRERALAVLLIGVIILGGGGFFGYQFVYSPWKNRSRELERLTKEAETKRQRLAEIEAHRADLARWRALSLPAEPDVARREYEKYLNDLLSRHGVVAGRYEIKARPLAETKVGPAGSNKEVNFTRLTFAVQAYATMDTLVRVLHEFYKTELMHQIKTLTIQRQLTTNNQTASDELDVHMTVEALIVAGADKRPYLFDRRLLSLDLATSLLRGPAGLGLPLLGTMPLEPEPLAEPPRSYAAIVKKNIFLGRPPKGDSSPEWMAPRFVHLTDITTNDGRTMAYLYDVSTNRSIRRLRPTTGFNQFSFVKDSEARAVAVGIVMKLEDREMVYRAEIAAEEPSRSSSRDGFFRLDKEEREKLVADGTVNSDDAAQVVRVDRSYWDTLVHQLVIRMSQREPDQFVIQLERDKDRPSEDEDQSSPVEVLRGKVVRREGSNLFLRVEERYYALHMGQSVEDSLKKPLPREEVKDLKGKKD
jgi:hypothetical protein